MKELTYSFIVPVYNGRNYIQRCVDSILKASKDGDEIILVDDASKDESLQLLLEIEKKYSNIRVIAKEKNAGSSAARNTGIEAATGDFIVFVDVDDYLLPDFRKAVDSFADKKYDYLIFAHSEEETVKEATTASKELTVADRDSLIISTLEYRLDDKILSSGSHFNLRSAWAKLIRTSFIREHRLSYKEGVSMGEDTIFSLRMYQNTELALIVDYPIYRYFRDNVGSITRSYKDNLLENRRAMDEELKKIDPSGRYTAIYSAYILDFLILHLRDDFFHVKNKRNKKENIEYIKKIIDDGSYLEAYRLAKKEGTLSHYPLSKRLFFFFASHSYYLPMKLSYLFKYGR